jgi:hypothetical protein
MIWELGYNIYFEFYICALKPAHNNGRDPLQERLETSAADFSFLPTDSLKGHRFEFVDELEDKSVGQLSRRSSNLYMFDVINIVGFDLNLTSGRSF